VHVLFWIAAGIAIGAALGAALVAGSLAAPRRLARGPVAAQHVDLDALLGGLGDLERRIFARVLRRSRTARDVNAEFEEQLTFGARLADRIAAFGGSWSFISLFAAVLLTWIAWNLERPGSFDPYPFILLNLVLSCLAALQGPVIMMSQNRMAAKDRLDARHDYEVNLKAEMEILQLLEKLDEIQRAIDRIQPS
jgi:uncharacterized membrane protein